MNGRPLADYKAFALEHPNMGIGPPINHSDLVHPLDRKLVFLLGNPPRFLPAVRQVCTKPGGYKRGEEPTNNLPR